MAKGQRQKSASKDPHNESSSDSDHPQVKSRKSGSRVSFQEVAAPVAAPVAVTEKASKKQSHAKSAVKATRVKREPNAWVKALKEYNRDSNVYQIPKKGSTQYEEVHKLMEKYR